MTDPEPVSTADAYLGLLDDRGVDYLFGNAGTDFGPLIDAYARRDAAGESSPRPLTIPHEITAVAMAHGYAMVSGRTPVVMVHTIAGTANAIGGLINANRAQIPMLFTAGRTPITEGDARGARDMHIHWAQESFDQGAMVREWVKWDYELRAGTDLGSVLDRAMAIAGSEPRGPVSLTLPRELLAAESTTAPGPGATSGSAIRSASDAPARTMASPADIAAAADLLIAAENPLIITRSAGRDPRACRELARLADVVGAVVIDPYPTNSNLDFDHPLHLVDSPDRHLAHADVIVIVESDVPWIPKRARPTDRARVIAIATDPLHGRYPLRDFPADIGLAGNLSLNLGALVAGLAGRLDGDVVAERSTRWRAEVDDARASARSLADAGRDAVPLQKPWFSAVLDDLLPDDALLVDELGCDVRQLRFSGPNRFFGVSQAGVLGWGLGAALGARLAAPDRPVVSVIGDGSYLFGAPTTAHWVARRYDLPVLFLVWNNAKWGAVEASTRMVYPDGHAARNDSFAFSDLQPAVDYELVCEAAGGVGERVDDPADLPGAIERGLKTVAGGRQALVNLIAHP